MVQTVLQRDFEAVSQTLVLPNLPILTANRVKQERVALTVLQSTLSQRDFGDAHLLEHAVVVIQFPVVPTNLVQLQGTSHVGVGTAGLVLQVNAHTFQQTLVVVGLVVNSANRRKNFVALTIGYSASSLLSHLNPANVCYTLILVSSSIFAAYWSYHKRTNSQIWSWDIFAWAFVLGIHSCCTGLAIIAIGFSVTSANWLIDQWTYSGSLSIIFLFFAWAFVLGIHSCCTGLAIIAIGFSVTSANWLIDQWTYCGSLSIIFLFFAWTLVVDFHSCIFCQTFVVIGFVVGPTNRHEYFCAASNRIRRKNRWPFNNDPSTFMSFIGATNPVALHHALVGIHLSVLSLDTISHFFVKAQNQSAVIRCLSLTWTVTLHCKVPARLLRSLLQLAHVVVGFSVRTAYGLVNVEVAISRVGLEPLNRGLGLDY